MRAIAYTAIIGLSALVDLSLLRIDSDTAGQALELSAAGALIAAVAIAIAHVSRDQARLLESSLPSQTMVGLKIGIVGFLAALVGYLVAAFLSMNAGYWLGMSGAAVGIVGMLAHFAIVLFANDDKASDPSVKRDVVLTRVASYFRR